MKKWDICIALVPFEDVPEAKPRPVIILDASKGAVDCLKMTSQPPRPGDYVLQKWQEAGLMKPTVVRLTKRLALDPSAVGKCIGSVHPIDIVEIQKRIT